MPQYSFYIYSSDVLEYDSASGAFGLSSDYDFTTDRLRVDVTDNDSTMDSKGDGNQSAEVYDSAGNLVASGKLYVPAYAAIQLPDGSTAFLDRIEVDGDRFGYVSTEPLDAGQTYPLLGSGTFEEQHQYYQQYSTPCFAPGTRIMTPTGDAAIETLRAGDIVETRDNGPQPIVWTAGWKIPSGAPRPLAALPVVLSEGVPGGPAPDRPLTLSAQHRVLLGGPACEALFATPEALGPACGLSVPASDTHALEWRHILLREHQLILANGIWVESLFLGRQALYDLPPAAALAAIGALGAGRHHIETILPTLTRRETQLLATSTSAHGNPAKGQRRATN